MPKPWEPSFNKEYTRNKTPIDHASTSQNLTPRKSVQNAVLNEWVLDSVDIEADYGRTRDDPYSRRFDEYKKTFDNKVEMLANEYDLRIGKKGYALDEYGENVKNSMGVHYTYGTIKDSKKKNDGRELDDDLRLGRAKGSRFMEMIRKEMNEEGNARRKTFSQQGDGIRDLIGSYSCDAKEARDIYEVINREYSPIPITVRRDIDNPNELCRTEEFTVIRHSIGDDEEFVTVGPSKINTVERTPGSMSCIYHKLLNRKDRRWEDLAETMIWYNMKKTCVELIRAL
ncbi:hypothetical protein Tco_0749893 [Tanacetum coccineum]|uniref:Uncharacterized protein n=1 Tax=Tanacetum coccineum TaxID=301880 RepID=A0ABQ4Z2T1_9ASTR